MVGAVAGGSAYSRIDLVPLVGVIVLIVFLATDGTPGDNRYGPSPKAAPGSAYGTVPSY